MHLPWTLLFLLLPCCFLVRDFTEVKGIMGGSLSMQCPYEEKHRTHGKSWCKGSSLVFCITLLETNGSEGEVKKGRVAIRDNHQNLIFSVTMENLSADDAASYACGIDEPFSFEPLLWFTVSISQGESPLFLAPGVLNVYCLPYPTSTRNSSVLKPLAYSHCAYLGAGESGTMNTCVGGYLLILLTVLMPGKMCGCLQMFVRTQ
uniref:Immunoglobulin V-set domain-containing protein n=1 Tax=Ornithorhynchus anatinus TaxID=9258 RepID=A0A6I8NYW1_ORNAN